MLSPIVKRYFPNQGGYRRYPTIIRFITGNKDADIDVSAELRKPRILYERI